MIKKSILSCVVLSFIPATTNAAFTSNVSSGTTVSGEIVDGKQTVYGVLNDSTVTSNQGWAYINGGVANNILVQEQGRMVVQNDGISNGTNLSNEGKLYIKAGGVSNNSTVGGKGVEYIEANGVSNSSNILTGGKQYVKDGGQAIDTTINGGVQYIYSGGVSTNATLNTGAMNVYGGKSTSSTILGGKQVVNQGGVSQDDTISGNGYQNIGKDGKAYNTIVMDGARQDINGGGYAKDSTVINAIYNIDPSAHGENVTLKNSIGMLYNGGKLSGTAVVSEKSALYLAESTNANVSVTGASSVHVLRDLSIDYLSISNSDVFFHGGNQDFGSNSPFSKLTVNSLSSSNSNIHMRVEGMQGDFLNVNNVGDGKSTLYISGSGKESSNGYHLIHAAGSKDDSFSLANGSVELGTYSYTLDKNNDDWFLRTNGLSSGASAITAYTSSLPVIFFNELKNLRYRLGNVTGDLEKNNGVWVRYLSEKSHSSVENANYDLTQHGVELGVDKKSELHDGKFMYGVLFSYSDNNIDGNIHGNFKNQVYSHGIGLYTTYMSDSGYYFDFISKVNRFTGELLSTSTSGMSSIGDYMNTGFGAAIEAGKKWSFHNDLWVEPFVKTEGFVANSKEIVLSNDMKAKLPTTKFIRGVIGINFGQELVKDKDLEITPYGSISMSHELKKKSSVLFNDTNVVSYSSPSNVINYGLGVDIKVKNELHLYGQANYSKGDGFESPINATLGVRVSF